MGFFRRPLFVSARVRQSSPPQHSAFPQVILVEVLRTEDGGLHRLHLLAFGVTRQPKNGGGETPMVRLAGLGMMKSLAARGWVKRCRARDGKENLTGRKRLGCASASLCHMPWSDLTRPSADGTRAVRAGGCCAEGGTSGQAIPSTPGKAHTRGSLILTPPARRRLQVALPSVCGYSRALLWLITLS